MPVLTLNGLAQKVLQGDRLAIGKAITLVENQAPEAFRLLEEVYSRCGRAHRIGITGPPGVGKSTLLGELAGDIRKSEPDARVGIIAVDPTSPFTGGALLGDRIRMNRLAVDEHVFIRSMATRGRVGGIARATFQAADVLDASGVDYLFIETVGAGQSEVEVATAVDTALVVLSPESGDAVQAMKSGILEIADFLVVNKSDRPGADLLVQSIGSVLGISVLGRLTAERVVKTCAERAEGVAPLRGAVDAFHVAQKKTGALDARRAANLRAQLRVLAEGRLTDLLSGEPKVEAAQRDLVAAILARKESPYGAVDGLFDVLKRFLK